MDTENGLISKAPRLEPNSSKRRLAILLLILTHLLSTSIILSTNLLITCNQSSEPTQLTCELYNTLAYCRYHNQLQVIGSAPPSNDLFSINVKFNDSCSTYRLFDQLSHDNRRAYSSSFSILPYNGQAHHCYYHTHGTPTHRANCSHAHLLYNSLCKQQQIGASETVA